MKKLLWLAVLAAMLFTTAANADGIDVKAKGVWDFAIGWADNTNFRGNRDGNRKDDPFIARQRIRPQFNFIASEYLQGVLAFEIGNMSWGRPNGQSDGGGALDTDGVNLETRRAYLDWLIPNTSVSVRMGVQNVSLPMANGYLNPIFSADVAGIVVNTPITDMVGLTAFWLRPFDHSNNDGANNHLNDEMDMFGLTLPITGSGWSVTPWGMYAQVGSASGYYDYLVNYNGDSGLSAGMHDQQKSAPAWWAGVSVELSPVDPLSFGFDVIYGRINRRELGIWDTTTDPHTRLPGTDEFGTRGWFVDAALNYTLDWAVPGIFGWYSSGDKKSDVEDKGQYGRIPVVGVDDGIAFTSFGFPGSYGNGTDSVVGLTAVGTWGVGAQLAEMSFIEDLSHTLRVAYYRGTNDHKLINGGERNVQLISAESVYMTDKDYAWEVNFDHTYKIYENLTAVVELGYINLHKNKKTWGDEHKTDDAWKAQLLFQYSF